MMVVWATIHKGAMVAVLAAYVSQATFHRTPAGSVETSVRGKWRRLAEGDPVADRGRAQISVLSSSEGEMVT